MKKLTCVLAILAAASTAAVAKDLKQSQKATQAPGVSAAQMTDSEMDRVTAGASFDTGLGIGTALDNPANAQSQYPTATPGGQSNASPGNGVCTVKCF
jgi:hypothetical protein